MGGTRISGSDQEGSTEAAPCTGRANTCVACHRGAAGHAFQKVRREREEEGERIRAFRATGGQRGTHLRK